MRDEKRNRNSKANRVSMSAIRSLAKQIAKLFDVEKIFLFGSYAYGTPRDESDVDLCVIIDRDKRDWRLHNEMYRSVASLRIPIDLVVRTRKEIDERIPLGDWFLKDIVEKGKVLYESNR